MTIEDSFKCLITNYAASSSRVDDYWNEIVSCYTQPHRHYHTLTHLNYLITALAEINTQLKKPDAVLLAAYYHDVIYDPLRSDNEEQSSVLARERLAQAGVPDCITQQTIVCIMATRSHVLTESSDANYFTDADLSVLGQAPGVYEKYSSDIRKEYGAYPDVVYQPARRQVLSAFLQMPQIFKTGFFCQKYEAQARLNIAAEIALIDRGGR
ncbi:HD domain-containing protein [Niabella hibiscisoli]|uniref:HD domain-containing protein n=1 Tax=Niabella hibiscisoli TaxID=1825928 RepID=UPI001F0E7D85|nr:hypothetical protein [Niabella hibiscisoli]MCH5716496.1 hypothetical protein [Niabella hibiscisoli]